MDNKEKHHSSHNGFLFGVLLGVAITLLFTTKKGRRILKSLTDEGLEKVNQWEDLVSRKIDEKMESINDDLEEPASNASQNDAGRREFVEVVEEPVARVTEAPVVSSKNGASHHTNGVKKEAPKADQPEVRHTVRRFFKSANKK